MNVSGSSWQPAVQPGAAQSKAASSKTAVARSAVMKQEKQTAGSSIKQSGFTGLSAVVKQFKNMPPFEPQKFTSHGDTYVILKIKDGFVIQTENSYNRKIKDGIFLDMKGKTCKVDPDIKNKPGEMARLQDVINQATGAGQGCRRDNDANSKEYLKNKGIFNVFKSALTPSEIAAKSETAALYCDFNIPGPETGIQVGKRILLRGNIRSLSDELPNLIHRYKNETDNKELKRAVENFMTFVNSEEVKDTDENHHRLAIFLAHIVNPGQGSDGYENLEQLSGDALKSKFIELFGEKHEQNTSSSLAKSPTEKIDTTTKAAPVANGSIKKTKYEFSEQQYDYISKLSLDLDLRKHCPPGTGFALATILADYANMLNGVASVLDYSHMSDEDLRDHLTYANDFLLGLRDKNTMLSTDKDLSSTQIPENIIQALRPTIDTLLEAISARLGA